MNSGMNTVSESSAPESRGEFLRLYYESGRLDPTEFAEHHEIRCHALLDRSAVIFFNLDTGAVSATLPSLCGLALTPSVISRIVRVGVTHSEK